MARIVLFEGKTTMGGMDVDLKIYRENEEDGSLSYYGWDYNPHLVDVDQAGVHIGEINMGHNLEEILFRIEMYKNEIRKIKEVKSNPNFLKL